MGDSNLVLRIFLVVAILAVAFMLLLANVGAKHPLPQETVTAGGYRLRRYWLWAISIGSILAFALTIPYFPYRAARAAIGAEHVRVVAQQYGFALPAVLPVNRPIVFDVVSKDVNHGFGIYDPKGALVGQVQAMPDYVNHLAMTFTVPGHYTLRCLEYCGIAHASMRGGFDVR